MSYNPDNSHNQQMPQHSPPIPSPYQPSSVPYHHPSQQQNPSQWEAQESYPDYPRRPSMTNVPSTFALPAPVSQPPPQVARPFEYPSYSSPPNNTPQYQKAADFPTFQAQPPPLPPPPLPYASAASPPIRPFSQGPWEFKEPPGEHRQIFESAVASNTESGGLRAITRALNRRMYLVPLLNHSIYTARTPGNTRRRPNSKRLHPHTQHAPSAPHGSSEHRRRSQEQKSHSSTWPSGEIPDHRRVSADSRPTNAMGHIDHARSPPAPYGGGPAYQSIPSTYPAIGQINREKVVSPVMSISQLLSDDTDHKNYKASKGHGFSRRTQQDFDDSRTESDVDIGNNGDEAARQRSEPVADRSMRFPNGIKNLLNSTSDDDAHAAADDGAETETDTEQQAKLQTEKDSPDVAAMARESAKSSIPTQSTTVPQPIGRLFVWEEGPRYVPSPVFRINENGRAEVQMPKHMEQQIPVIKSEETDTDEGQMQRIKTAPTRQKRPRQPRQPRKKLPIPQLHPAPDIGEETETDRERQGSGGSHGSSAATVTDHRDSSDASNSFNSEPDSDVEDDRLFELHKREIVRYMVEVYRRSQRVIKDYENNRKRKTHRLRKQVERSFERRFGHPMTYDGDEWLRATRNHQISKKRRKAMTTAPYWDGSDRSDDRAEEYFDDDEHPALIETEEQIRERKILEKREKDEQELEEQRKKIWLSIARKDIPRMAKIVSRSQATRVGNCKKIAQMCQKEVRRAALKSGKSNRDIQAKAKRAMREMLMFWKKNEKEERELRKKAEKEALERLRIEEEMREAKRQARKLNFLITQTELYSHFIGKKIKGAADEDSDATVAIAADQSESSSANNLDHGELELDNNAPSTLGEINFDEDDDEKLKEQARRSAKSALMMQVERTRHFDEGAKERRLAADEKAAMAMTQDAFDEMNFQNPSSLTSGIEVQQPKMLMCQLKNYQLKGLNWLVNLYEQGINGILADEMGLGKTVQSIALMAHLAETYNIWGPFLVIAPASTLHNWQQEVSKFVPAFKALPYWGNMKDRKTLRKFWNKKQLYGKEAPFHVLITSYQLVVTDEKYFQRVKWQYMVLDEAQAIKSSSSARWKTLLGFHCRNRLLLTGTPIQNSMQELWALLHFIMPTLFDSHEEFSEWFSKDIESHAENKGTLNEHQLRRLHMILKPFMLRRIKRNVQNELGEKIELEVSCDLTARQRTLYRGLKDKISVAELLEKATSLNESESMDSLMNLVMQFRKVCNHPELFERADVRSPFTFCEFSITPSISREGEHLYCPYTTRSAIKFHIPKQLYRQGGILTIPSENSVAGFSTRYLDNLMNIWQPDYIHQSMFSDEPDAAFSFLRFVDTTPSEANAIFFNSVLSRLIAVCIDQDHKTSQRYYAAYSEGYPDSPVNTFASLLISATSSPLSPVNTFMFETLGKLTDVVNQTIFDLRTMDPCYSPNVLAAPVDVLCSDKCFANDQKELMFHPFVRAALIGDATRLPPIYGDEAVGLSELVSKANGEGLIGEPFLRQGFSHIKVPAMKDLIMDSGKLAKLDKLLEVLKAEGHRCLIYFQMTRMIDLMEEYLAYRQYKYLRLDGSSKISDRRDMVTDWQTRPEIFIFLLSTRAGGLGINLTAADTVIFYDSDWNPTVDQQAMDRAHRLGQTKQVTVYRLITKGTIEERILQRAKQKDEIQKVVISGGEFKQVDFKPREIVSLLLDDEELENKLQQQLKRKAEDAEEAKQKKSTARPAKRQKKDNATISSIANAPNPGALSVTGSSIASKTLDELMAAGGDILPEDSGTLETPTSVGAGRKRPAKPRTLKTPKEKKELKDTKEPKEPRKTKKKVAPEAIDPAKDSLKELEDIEVVQ
ncbi:SNF2 family N-terminal domain-containing protein [Jimgerdemannia flammicorona]|uniref:Chromatin-remodeling ATPase INO80 n=1 Tax=Jimgerdemannia flammicorona TaxID=994334 RepID=A0A433D5W6_9FUNG|nr:SNF2 family N-terminal domain-containing protein [Jimgerdemannia flammicorona]